MYHYPGHLGILYIGLTQADKCTKHGLTIKSSPEQTTQHQHRPGMFDQLYYRYFLSHYLFQCLVSAFKVSHTPFAPCVVLHLGQEEMLILH